MPETDYISIHEKKIYCEFWHREYGDGKKPTLVFLHEGLGCVAGWKDIPAVVASRLQLPALVYDRIGYGRSDGKVDDWTLEFIHEEAYKILPALLDSAQINGRIVLVGHSDGGSISLLFASKFSQRVSAVVSIAAHVLIEDVSLQGIRSLITAFDEGPLKASLSQYHGKKTDSLFYSWAFNWLKEDAWKWNIESELQGIDSPVLAIQGDRDQYGSRIQLDSIRENIPGKVELVWIADCGHNPHFESRTHTLNKIIDFISREIARGKNKI